MKIFIRKIKVKQEKNKKGKKIVNKKGKKIVNKTLGPL